MTANDDIEAALLGCELHLREFDAFEGKSNEQALHELIDREELRQLVARYSHRIARSRTVDDLFTEDGAYVQRLPGKPPKFVRGRRAIASLYVGWVPDAADSPKPMIHNLLLRVAGDEAVGLSSNEVRMTAEGQSLIGSAYYRDRFRREDGRWRISLRDSTFFHLVPLARGWAS